MTPQGIQLLKQENGVIRGFTFPHTFDTHFINKFYWLLSEKYLEPIYFSVSYSKLLSSLIWITAIISFLVPHFRSYPFQSISLTINSPGYPLPLLKSLQRLSTAVRKTFKLIIIASKALWLDLCLAFSFLLNCSPSNPLCFGYPCLLAAPRWSQLFPPHVLCLCLKDSLPSHCLITSCLFPS